MKEEIAFYLSLYKELNEQGIPKNIELGSEDSKKELEPLKRFIH